MGFNDICHLHTLWVDTVVGRVKADKSDQDQANCIINLCNKPVLVSADVEDRAIACHEIDCSTELGADIARPKPPRACRSCVPELERRLRSGMAKPKLAERSLGNDLHDCRFTMFSICEQRYTF
jgi:hypothetical protein